MEQCPVCGFVWDDVAAADVRSRLTTAAAAIRAELEAAAAVAERRAGQGRWSMLEYGAHVRDVVINVRDRIILGVVEDNPEPKRMYGDARIDLGLCAADTIDVVSDELEIVAQLFGRTFEALTPPQLERPIHYGWPAPATRTLRWVGAQAVHEAEHHLTDVVEVRGLVGG